MTVVTGYLGAFNARVLGAKRFRADRNEWVQTTILGPRIMLEHISHHLLDALSLLPLGYLGAFNARVLGAETFSGQSQRTCPNNHFRS